MNDLSSHQTEVDLKRHYAKSGAGREACSHQTEVDLKLSVHTTVTDVYLVPIKPKWI